MLKHPRVACQSDRVTGAMFVLLLLHHSHRRPKAVVIAFGHLVYSTALDRFGSRLVRSGIWPPTLDHFWSLTNSSVRFEYQFRSTVVQYRRLCILHGSPDVVLLLDFRRRLRVRVRNHQRDVAGGSMQLGCSWSRRTSQRRFVVRFIRLIIWK